MAIGPNITVQSKDDGQLVDKLEEAVDWYMQNMGVTGGKRIQFNYVKALELMDDGSDVMKGRKMIPVWAAIELKRRYIAAGWDEKSIGFGPYGCFFKV